MSKGYLYDNGDELISREDALPDTNGASAGDVLSLDSDKEPVWSAPSGGGGGLVISVDLTGDPIELSDNYSGYPTDKTWNDVKEAIEGGSIPSIIIPEEDAVTPLFVMFVDKDGLTEYPYRGRLMSSNVPGEIVDEARLYAASADGVMYYAFSQT